MSEKVEIFSKKLVENALLEAVHLSGNKNETGIIDEAFQPENPILIDRNFSEKMSQIQQTINELADFFENFHHDVPDHQVGDYVLRVKVFPLEIQLKRAISNIHVAEIENGNIMNNGKGDVNVSLTLPSATSTPPAIIDENSGASLEVEERKIKKRMPLVTRLRRFFRLGNSRPRSS